ncbi:MAG TPA: AsmA family protein [Aestuariivirgaceae bacterium]|nr:AsmA family protein [Aestuariivirgaceae bacterium]
MSRIFPIAGLVTAGIIVGLVLGWLLLPGLGGSEIRQAVARDTGRTISFAGSPRLSVWPELAIELRDVELSNPTEMGDGRFAAADTVRLELAGSSLWRGAPEITQVVVTRPRINLLVDVEGRSNFAFERDGEPDRALPPVVIVDGKVNFLNERAGTAIAVADVDMTLSRSGFAGPVELDGAFNWNDQRLQMSFYAKSAARLAAGGSPADFTIAGPYLSAAFSGQAAIREGLELAGTLEFTAEPLADLLSWAGHASAVSSGLPALSASGALDLSGGAIRLSKAELTFGQMNAKGDVALGFTGAKPRLTGDLGIDRIDLTGLAGDAGGGWSEAPVDLEVLEALDAELSLDIAELAWGKLVAGAARLDVALKDGVMETALEDATLYGGSARGRLKLDGSGPLVMLEAALDAAGIDGGKLSAGLAAPVRIRGQVDVDFDLKARGASQQELVARLRGTAHVKFRDGALIDFDVPALLGHVEAQVADGWAAAAGGETPFSRLDASFAIEDGIAETEDLALRGPGAKVDATGSIDLLSRRLDLQVHPQALPVAVVIAGPWAAPKIHPDITGILDNPEQAYDALRRRMVMDAAKLDLSTRDPENEPDDAAATR